MKQEFKEIDNIRAKVLVRKNSNEVYLSPRLGSGEL
jgi:hypothetical protein